jgi:hypothetical protein
VPFGDGTLLQELPDNLCPAACQAHSEGIRPDPAASTNDIFV